MLKWVRSDLGELAGIKLNLLAPIVLLVAGVLAIPPSVTCTRWARTRRRRRLGLCVKCGYDLRGLPEPRCPECGRAFDPGEIGVLAPTSDCGAEHRSEPTDR